MKSLRDYIIESIEEENVLWLLDKWFERNEEQQSEFTDLVIRSIQDRVPQVPKIKEYLRGTTLEHNLKEFINFVDNEVEPQNEKDYYYRLKCLITQIMKNDRYTTKGGN